MKKIINNGSVQLKIQPLPELENNSFKVEAYNLDNNSVVVSFTTNEFSLSVFGPLYLRILLEKHSVKELREPLFGLVQEYLERS